MPWCSYAAHCADNQPFFDCVFDQAHQLNVEPWPKSVDLVDGEHLAVFLIMGTGETTSVTVCSGEHFFALIFEGCDNGKGSVPMVTATVDFLADTVEENSALCSGAGEGYSWGAALTFAPQPDAVYTLVVAKGERAAGSQGGRSSPLARSLHA